ncbi:MipA/OmpV family protein [Yoonia sp.]|uniref:MipA/OmpV family protein n=1 Tax=Yoonia sp. TaxID=2212373 RepID=UPI0035C87BAA
MLLRFVAIAALIVTPVFAAAQDGGNELSFRFGVGPKLQPGYFGDADQDTGVGVNFALESLRIGPVANSGDANGLGFGGSFRYIGERNAEDFSELAGMETIDRSLEIGGQVKYVTPLFEAFASLRYGAIGHKSFVSELGGDLVVRPAENLRITAGPRALWGDEDYASTYFGVSAQESADNGVFAPFAPDSGIISTGAEIEATYAFSDDWELVGTLKYYILRGDAADSPISEDNDQVTTQIVLTRKVTFNF